MLKEYVKHLIKIFGRDGKIGRLDNESKQVRVKTGHCLLRDPLFVHFKIFNK